MTKLKYILFFGVLSSLTQVAHASKARVLSLNQDVSYGSYYFTDFRSSFRNPSYAYDYGNLMVTEWGTASNATSTGVAPHAEGGLFYKTGNDVFGFYFGNEVNSHNEQRQDATGLLGEVSLLPRDNVTQFFWARDVRNVQWGLSFEFTRAFENTNVPNVDKKHDSYWVSLGGKIENIESYVQVNLKDNSKTGDNERDLYKLRSGVKAGLVWAPSFMKGDLAGARLFLDHTVYSSKYTNDSSSPTFYEKETTTVGVGKVFQLGSTSVNADLSFVIGSEGYTNLSSTYFVFKNQYLPVTIGITHALTEAITLRGSISHEILGIDRGLSDFSDETKNNKTATRSNKTTVNAGLGVQLGKFTIDGLIGTTGTTRAPTGTNTGIGIISLDNLMSQASVAYSF